MAGECPRGAPGPGERAGALALEGFLRRRVYPEQREHRGRERESRAVQALVAWLMARVHDCDPRLFTGEALLVGSQAQDLHVQAESGRGDYDVLAPIQFRTPLLLLGSLYRQPRTRLRFLPSWLCLRPGVPVYRWENKLLADYNTVTLRDTLDSKFLETELTDADIAEINRRQRDLWRGGIDPFLVTRKLHEFCDESSDTGGKRAGCRHQQAPAAGLCRAPPPCSCAWRWAAAPWPSSWCPPSRTRWTCPWSGRGRTCGGCRPGGTGSAAPCGEPPPGVSWKPTKPGPSWWPRTCIGGSTSPRRRPGCCGTWTRTGGAGGRRCSC
ncbi:uncharacterized protein LOC142829312 [Pelodiscus sinensis]|uniref:uncharacterized protein LOC142829312 n=1 Tax=Pelodiscus sinensis TaxID=13735 RepID=UPI003F6CDAD3